MRVSKIIQYFPTSFQDLIRKKYYAVKFKKADIQEEKELVLLSKLIRKGDVLADIGANYGLYTKFLSMFAGENGQVHSFEPIAKTFTVLNNNIQTLALKNVRAHHCALSDSDGKATMEVPSYSDGGENLYEARISESTEPSSEVVHLSVFDELMGPDTSFHFIKCDVEGHEINVLKGAKEHLKNDQPLLLIEINGGIKKENENAQVILSFLSSFDYSPYKIKDGRLVAVNEPDNYFNYFFLTPAHEKEFSSLII